MKAAAAGRATGGATAAALVAEVLHGAPPRPLPSRITAALAELEAAQRSSRRRAVPGLNAAA